MNSWRNKKIIYRSKLKTNIKFKMPRKIIIYNGILWVSSFGDNCIFLLDPETEILKGKVSFSRLKNPRGMYPLGNYIYVACYGDPMGGIVCFNVSTLEEIMYFEVPRPRGLVISGNEIFITEVMEHRISVFDLNGKLKRYIGTGILQCPRGITIDNQENIIIADSGNHRIIFLNKDGYLVNTVDKILSPNDVTYYNNKIFVSQWFDKCIQILDPVIGKIGETYIIPQGSGFLAMIYINNNNLYVSDDDGYVHVFNIN